MSDFTTLYHVTTPRKAKKYQETGYIRSPVRGFLTLKGAMYWAMKTGRTVILECKCHDAHKLPDHHNAFGDAWWNDANIATEDYRCVVSAGDGGLSPEYGDKPT